MNNYQLGHYQLHIQQGWQCPQCKAVMAPSAMMCWFCTPKKDEVKVTMSEWDFDKMRLKDE